MFYESKKQETTKIGTGNLPSFCYSWAATWPRQKMNSGRLKALLATVVCLHLGAYVFADCMNVRNVARTNATGRPLVPLEPPMASDLDLERADESRVLLSSVIRAPKFKKPPCPVGERRDPKGTCRKVWS
ncbi:hypothetical protein AAG570_005656 [Ranatra chinensis]|uniref:Uncharacterized protein n=1 Tax=Ranatra chinensis TaxID=642074 RepID=A0ABD0XY57_9HEMI